MNLDNAEIALSIDLQGALASRGHNTIEPKLDENGKPVMLKAIGTNNKVSTYPAVTLKSIKQAVFHQAAKSVTLGERFVQHAISSKGKPHTIDKAAWNNMSQKKRLISSIKEYARDMYPGCSYTYTIIE